MINIELQERKVFWEVSAENEYLHLCVNYPDKNHPNGKVAVAQAQIQVNGGGN